MAVITSTATGLFSAGATWVGGVKPGASDTFIIASGHVVTCDSTEVMSTGLSLINLGGELQIISSGDLTARITNSGKFTMVPGSIFRMNGNFTASAGSDYDIEASIYDNNSAGTSDIEIYQIGVSRFDGASITTCTGIIKGVRFISGGGAYILYRWNMRSLSTELSMVDVIIISPSVNYSVSTCQLRDFGTWLILDPAGAYPIIGLDCYGTGTIKIINNSGACTYLPYLCYFFDNTVLHVIDNFDGNIACSYNSRFSGNSSIILEEGVDSSGYSLYVPYIFENTSINLSVKRTGLKSVIGNAGFIITTGQIIIDATEVTGEVRLFYQIQSLTFSFLRITMPAQILSLTYGVSANLVWTMSRNRIFEILGSPTSVGHYIPGSQQFEPISYNAGSYLMTVQHDIVANAPNYDDLYRDSIDWTPSSQQLAATTGVLNINTTGWHDTPTSGKTGMSVGILSLALIATTITGTLSGSETLRYKISFDGGVIWSGELTEAQLQADSWTINGETYTPDPIRNVQLQIIIKNETGGAATVTQVVTTGIEFDPDAIEKTIEDYLLDIQGSGFDTDQHSLVEIKDGQGGGVNDVNVIQVQGTTVLDITDFHGIGTIPALGVSANILAVNGSSVSSVNDFKASVASMSSVNVIQVRGVTVSSVDDFKANVSSINLNKILSYINKRSNAIDSRIKSNQDSIDAMERRVGTIERRE